MNIYEQRIFFFFTLSLSCHDDIPITSLLLAETILCDPKRDFPRKMSRSFIRLSLYLTQSSKERKWFCWASDSGRVFYHGQKRISKPMTTMDCFWFSSQLKEIKSPLGFIYEILSHLIFSVIPYKEKMNESAAGTKCGWRPITADTKLIVTCCCNFSRAIKMNFNTRKKKEKQEKGKNFNKC